MIKHKNIKKLTSLALLTLMLAIFGFPSYSPSLTSPMEADAQEDSMKLLYGGFLHGIGWSPLRDDNVLCTAPMDSYLTALRAALVHQPEGMTGTVAYQVNLSGIGWLDWVENNAQTGNIDGKMPLEAVRMKLTGQLAQEYDIYYSVLQMGAWTPWAMNETTAGQENAGLRIDGIRMSVTKKGDGEPAATPAAVRIDSARPMVALTFDDGPYAPVTNRILSSLETNSGRATFFMVGSRVKGKANAECVRRMFNHGSEAANHTFDHKILTKLETEEMISQMSRASRNIRAACGVSPTLMRPPGGAKDSTVISAANSLGLTTVMWSIDTLDWKTKNKQKTIDVVLNHIKDGDIVLMHDLYGATADAAEVMIPELTARGYQLVTVSELVRYRGGKGR